MQDDGMNDQESAGAATEPQPEPEAGESQLEAINRQGELLGQLGEREAELETLQRRLIDNIVALRAAETFEQTMHSLSAAVHLLTAHVRQRAA